MNSQSREVSSARANSVPSARRVAGARRTEWHEGDDMTRTLIALVLGALLGVASTLLLTRDETERIRPDSLSNAFAPATSADPSSAPAYGGSGSGFYRRLAVADTAELASMIAQVAAQPPSPDRELGIAVLLRRYAEIDAARAARLAREIRARGPALGAVYSAWARTNRPQPWLRSTRSKTLPMPPPWRSPSSSSSATIPRQSSA